MLAEGTTKFFTFFFNVQSNLHVSVSALVAAAVVWMSELPAKLNPIILPLMASVKREQVVLLKCVLLCIPPHACIHLC